MVLISDYTITKNYIWNKDTKTKWNSVEIRGISWKSVEYRGILWNLVEIRALRTRFYTTKSHYTQQIQGLAENKRVCHPSVTTMTRGD